MMLAIAFATGQLACISVFRQTRHRSTYGLTDVGGTLFFRAAKSPTGRDRQDLPLEDLRIGPLVPGLPRSRLLASTGVPLPEPCPRLCCAFASTFLSSSATLPIGCYQQGQRHLPLSRVSLLGLGHPSANARLEGNLLRHLLVRERPGHGEEGERIVVLAGILRPAPGRSRS